MLFGMLNEWVFCDINGNGAYDFTLSRLDWQLDPLCYAGVSLSLEPLPRFFIGFGGWLGIPGTLGFLEDRDWDLGTGIYIIFSHHDNVLVSAQFADINLGYSIVYENNFVLNAITGFNFKRFTMSGRNGYQEIPPGTPFATFPGEVINYECNIFIPYFAAEAAWAPLPFLSIDAFISVSPPLTFVYARDNHVGGNYFVDRPQFGFFITGILNLSLHLGAGFDLRLHNMVMWLPPIKGTTYVLTPGNDYFTTNPLSRGGSSLIIYGITISIGLSL
jgi:hypothetical protein